MFFLEQDSPYFNNEIIYEAISDTQVSQEVTYFANSLLGFSDEDKENSSYQINGIMSAESERTVLKVVKKEKEAQRRLIDSIKLKAKEDGLEVIKNIQNYGIEVETKEGQRGLIEIAKIIAKQNGYQLALKIKNFGINAETEPGQKGLIEIANIVAQQNGLAIAYDIQSFDINPETKAGQKGLFEIAKIVAFQDGDAISEHIKNFGINAETKEGQRRLIEIAKIAAGHGSEVAENIQEFEIDAETEGGQKGLIEIAKIVASKNGYALSEHIQNFDINKETGQRDLIEIAKIAARQDGLAVSENIQNFGIVEEMGLIEIAKVVASQNAEAIINNIENFNIDTESDAGQRGLIEIAMVAASQHGRAVSDHIMCFDIDRESQEGQKGLIEIAKIAAAQNLSIKSEHFSNFGINKKTPEGQKILIEIAKSVASQNGFIISNNIQEYGIHSHTEDGQEALIEISLIAASQNGAAVSENIQNFDIDETTDAGQKALIKIAKIAAKSGTWETVRNLKNYKINKETEKGQKGLIEIAMIAAEQNGHAVAVNIESFGIKKGDAAGQEGLIEIAKIAAYQDPRSISLHIQDFGINDQSALIEIAKIAAAESGDTTTLFLQNYGIDQETEEGQEGFIEIARIAVRNDWRAFNNLFEQIKSSSFKLELTFYTLANVLKEAQSGVQLTLDESPSYEILKNLSPEENSDLRNVPLEAFKTFVQEIKKLVNKKWPTNKSLQDILKQIAELQKPARMNCQEHRVIQMQQLNFVLMALADCFNLDVPQIIEQFVPIISASLKLRDPKMREDIWNLLFKNNLSFTPALKTPIHAILPALLLNYLLGDTGKEISMIIQSLRDKKNIIFKDADYNKLLLKTLLELYETTSLEEAQKKELLVRALSYKIEGKAGDKDNINKALQLIKGIIAFGAGDKLKEALQREDFIEVLNQIYLEAFRKVVPIKDDIVNFAAKFESLQSQLRMPDAVLTYASTVKKLKKDESKIVLQALATCFEEVLEGTFKDERYKNSCHLADIFKEREELKKEWKKGGKCPLIAMLGKDTTDKETDYIKQLLIMFDDGHADKKAYPELYIFLQTQDPVIQLRLNEQLKAASKEEEKSIKLQMKLIELTKAKENEKELLHDIIENYLPKLNEPNFSGQFDADIKWLYSTLLQKEAKNDYSDWTIEDTDNFEDLFLSGTEVEGSCQNINGNPYYNKCLLGYVLDGKNRLLAIKDGRGKIQARAIFRLLLKSNEPALLIERIYPKILPNQLEAALENFAIHRSKLLQLDLLSKEVGVCDFSQLETLTSLSSRAPFEYVDSQDGIHEDGQYSIYESYYIHPRCES